MNTIEITNNNGLLSYEDDNNKNICLGYICHIEGIGSFEPELGKINISAEDAQKHNLLYDKIVIDSINKSEIGQGNYLYIDGNNSEFVAKTWIGTEVGKAVKRGSIYYLYSNGMVFTAKENAEETAAFFKRIT